MKEAKIQSHFLKLKGAVMKKSTKILYQITLCYDKFTKRMFINLSKNFNTVKRAHLFKASSVIVMLLLVGRSIDVMSERNVHSNTTLVHSLAMTPKNPKRMNPVAFLTAQVFSSLLVPLNVVVVPEMSTMKALNVLLFHVHMSLSTAAPTLKLSNVRVYSSINGRASIVGQVPHLS